MNLYPWAIKHSVSLNALEDLKQQMGIAPFLASGALEPPVAESVVTKKIRLEAANDGILLWRNNVGAYYDDNTNFIRYGLANDTATMNKHIKSSDLIGIKPNGQFICREVKASDWQYTGSKREQAQLRFIELILSKGGDAEFSTGH